MSEFAKLVEQVEGANGARRGRTTRPAPRTFSLKPEHFAGAYEGRPVVAITIGIRVPSENEARSIEAESLKQAAASDGDMDSRVDVYNQTLFTLYVARGICNPHDVTAHHPLFELPEDMIPLALTPRAIKSIFDEIERLHVDQSPLFPEATQAELLELSDRLAADNPFANTPTAQRLRALRYLRLALDTLRSD